LRKIHNRYFLLAMGLSLMAVSLITACTKPPDVGPEIGNSAPDFTLKTITGENVALSDSKGKIVIINFWMTGCKGCVNEMSHIQTVFNRWSDKKLTILAINVMESTTIVKDFVSSQELTFTILLDPNGQVSRDYGGLGVPTTFLIDGKGIIKAIKHSVFQSPDEIENMLESL